MYKYNDIANIHKFVSSDCIYQYFPSNSFSLLLVEVMAFSWSLQVTNLENSSHILLVFMINTQCPSNHYVG